MTGVTNAELAAALQQVIAQVDAREDQLKAWQSGAADEGPYADGRFPIVNLLGEIGYFKSPARLAHEVGLLTSAADGALAQCLAAQATAQAAATLSETKANTASSAAATATTKANQADTFRQQAANSEANALVHRNNASTSATTATAAATTAEDAADVAVAAKDDAVIARNAAQAAAAAAATFNPNDFYTKAASDSRFLNLSNFTWANLDGKPSTFTPSAHGHIIADISGLQTALDGKQAAGSYVTTEGFTWSALAGKPTTFTPAAHTHVISDTTGLQTALDGKQPVGNYSLVGHGHVVSDISGLQTALDGKQPVGNYSLVGHGHVISDISGLQTALDGKQAAGSYVTTANFTWSNLSGKPSTFTPSAHTHIISDVTGLQTALDGKQAAGNYSLVGHGHVIADISGLQTALDGKQAAGSYVTTTNFTWSNLSGKPSTFTPSTHTHAIGDVTGLATELTSKVTRRTGEVSFGIQTYGATAWAMDGVTGAGIGGWARHFSIKGGELDSHAGFFAVHGLNTQAAEVRIGVGTADNGYTQGNALRITSSEMSWNGAVLWHGGNFSPSSKADVGHGHVISDISGLQTALDGKAASGHTHSQYATIFQDNNFGRLFTTGVQVNGVDVSLNGHGHGRLESNTGEVDNALQYWQAQNRSDINPDASWWYSLRMSHGSAENYYSATMAFDFFSDAIKVRRKQGGVNGSWISLWHSSNFDPSTKADVGHTHAYLPLSGGVVGGTLEAGDLLARYSSATSWTSRAAVPWEHPVEVLDMNENGFAAITFHVYNKYANLFGYDENNVLKTNNSIIWHSGNFNPDAKADQVHAHTISNISGLQSALDGKQAAGSYAPAVHTHDYLPLGGGTLSGILTASTINLGDSSKFIRGGAAGQTILGVADVNQAYVQVGNSYYSIWNAGNFDPTTKADVGHTHAYLPLTGGTLTGNLAAADIYASRGDTTGVIYFGNQSGGGRWLYYDGSSYYLANAGLNAGGSVYANGNIGATGDLTINGGSPVYRSSWTNDFQSTSDFVDGTLVETDITANVQDGDSFEIEITGKSYDASKPPYKVIAQGYLYSNTIISASGISYGGQFSDSIKVFERNGVLCFWWPRISYWNSFRVSVVSSMQATNGTITRNRVTAITNSAEPSSSKKVTIALHRSIQTAPGGAANIQRPYSLLLNLFNDGGLGSRLQFADLNWSANILHNSGNLMFQTQGENTRMFIGNGVVGLGTSNPALALVVSNGGAGGLEFNHSGAIGNGTYIQSYNRATGAYIHNTNYAIGHTWYTGGTRAADLVGGSLGIGVANPVTSLDTAGDITARGGNLFIRENPAGAGAGLRLHHNGGSGYVDFDGDLNFRTGEGNGLASLSSGGAFTASDISSVGNVRAGNTSGIGFTIMNAGTTGNPGYLSWYHPNGTRLGYMGWSDGGSNIVYQAEAGWGFKFNSKVELGGTTFNASSNVNIHGGVNQFYSNGNPQTHNGPSLQAYTNDNASGAWMSFHRAGQFAINMGLDTSNVFRIGGWSAGNLFALDTSGNLTLTGALNATGLGISGAVNFSSTVDFAGTTTVNGTFNTYGGANLYSTVNVFGGALRVNSTGSGDSAMGAYVGFRNNLGAERGWVGYGDGTSRMRLYNGIGDVLVQGSSTQIDSYGGGNTRISTTSGYVEVGPLNTSYCHFNTDRPAFYFGQRVEFQAIPLRYGQGAFLHHSSTSLGSGAITVSTASPSGGSDGDIWIKVAS